MKNMEQQDLVLTTSRQETQSSKSVREYSDTPIPDDLLIEIFSRVQGNSIARFRWVSKYWASIIRRSDFTELFLTKSLTRPRLLFTVSANGKLFFYSAPQPQNPDDNSSLVATPYHTSKYSFSHISRTLCGLVLILEMPVIYNPATGEFLPLPKVPLEEQNLPNHTEIAKMYCLGYDPVGKKFKVLCLTSSYDERETTHLVLTLESGKRVWRRVQHKFPFVKNRRIFSDICINGVLYFGAEFGKSTVMVCFDVRSEKFRFINTNEVMEQEDSSVMVLSGLFNYKGKLGIHHKKYNRYNRHETIVLWVLDDATGNHKWFKHVLVLSPLEAKMVEYTKVVGMTGTGDIVFSTYLPVSCYCLVFYNMERKTFTRVKIEGLKVEEVRVQNYVNTFIDYAENMEFMCVH